MKYSQIFKQAWALAKTDRFLWALGLVLIAANAANIAYVYDDTIAWLGILVVTTSIISFWAEASAIAGIKAVIDHQEISLKKTFVAGRMFFWRVLGISVLLGLVVTILSFIIATPISYLFSIHLVGRAVILIGLGSAILVPVGFVLSLVNVLSPIFIVLFDLKISEALSTSFALVSKHWPKLLVFALLLLLWSICGVILSALCAMPFVFLAFMAYHKLSVIVGLIAILPGLSVLAIFQQASWVLLFLELVKPEKIEEKRPAAVPEVV